MEVNFKKQLAERLEFVNSLLKEMKEKEKEFEEYCRQAEIDRKFIYNQKIINWMMITNRQSRIQDILPNF